MRPYDVIKKKRDGHALSEAEIRARLLSQHDARFFKEHCDYILENNGDEGTLLFALNGILEKIYIYR